MKANHEIEKNRKHQSTSASTSLVDCLQIIYEKQKTELPVRPIKQSTNGAVLALVYVFSNFVEI